MKRIELDVSEDFLKTFDETIQNKYNTRAEAIRDAMRLLLKQIEEES